MQSHPVRRALIAVLAGLAIAAGGWRLLRAESGLAIARDSVGPVPVTVFEPSSGPSAPTIVIAHGFAGSQQLMQPFAVTLARNGYRAITFDFPGHGRNAAPLTGGLDDHEGRGRVLTESLDAVVAFARGRAGADRRLALLGHSMASDIVIGYARDRPEIASTVAVSAFSRDVTASRPRNLLIVDGGLEPAAMIEAGRAIVAMAAGSEVRPGITYGSFADGTARRLALAEGVEHIGVLYSGRSLREALDWFDAAFGRRGGGFVDSRGAWLALLFGGLIALGQPLSRLLPKVSRVPAGAELPWRRFALVAVLPAILTPLLLWKVPGGFLPLLLGDYLALHFALYGILTAAGLWLARRFSGVRAVEDSWLLRRPSRVPRLRFGIAAICAAAFCTVPIALATDRFVTSFVPIPERLPLMLAMLVGTLPWFLADEWLTRGPGTPRGAYVATKICFLLSLAAAILLNLPKLFFLIIIVPAILLLFVIYGLLSYWTYRRTGYPGIGAVANACAFAWAIAVTFPVVG